MDGYMNKILDVDLSKGTISIISENNKTLEEYIGGSGLGTKMLWDRRGFDADPLSAENPIIFMTGPFANTPAITSGRHSIVTKSPLTGCFAESDVGGTWGPSLKRAGYDGIVISGKARQPVYLLVTDSNIEIRAAEHLWGKDSFETEESIRKETGEKSVTACIGPAGEKQVPIAAIMHDGRAARAAGRCGLGAVMGSKSLKAITVLGREKTPIYDKKGLLKCLSGITKEINKNLAGMSLLGTGGALASLEEVGALPLKNWKGTERWKEGAAKITGAAMKERMGNGKYGCERCVVKCGREIHIKGGVYDGLKGAGPEYETLASLGSLCLVSDVEAIAYANDLCNRYGIDTISIGGIIAFAMEAFEKGIITKGDTGGIDLSWGSSDAMVETVRMICENKGIGSILSRGVLKAAKAIGKGAEEFAIHSNGLEFPMHDPRAYMTLAVEYATSARGACHLSGLSHGFERSITLPEIGLKETPNRLATANKGVLTAMTQDVMGILDSLKVCKFMLFGGLKLKHLAEWYSCITGKMTDAENFMICGERIFNLKRLFNLKCGINPEINDRVPSRILELPKEAEGWETKLTPFNKILQEYYSYRGWNSEGYPTKEKLNSLGLNI